ncbi:MAG: DoxX family protein [Fibrobacterales bacterium]
MEKVKTTYWVTTELLNAMMLMSVVGYLTQYDHFKEAFSLMGYPTYIILSLAILKTFGITVILIRKIDFFAHLDYACFFCNFVLAFFGHSMIGDGQYFGAVTAKR